MKENKPKTIIKSYFLFGLACFFVNYALSQFGIINISFRQVFFLHTVLFSMFIFSALSFSKSVKTNSQKLSLFMLSINFIRIAVSIVFLSKQDLFNDLLSRQISQHLVINFFIIYFMYLYMEITLLKKNQV